MNHKAYFPNIGGGDILGPWIQFQTGNYQIGHEEFYSA
jgi:hypothetical protein